MSKIIHLDITDESSVYKAANLLKDEPIDLLINNAGMGSGCDISDVTKAEMIKLFEVNAIGPFLFTRALLPNLKLAVAKNGSATVGQITSRMASIDDNKSGGRYSYRASKAALNMLNKSLSVDLKNDKIIMLALHPGYVVTRMTGNTGKLTTEESVAALSKIISNATLEDSGNFYDYSGSTLPW